MWGMGEGSSTDHQLRNLIISLRHLKCEMLMAAPREVFSWPTAGQTQVQFHKTEQGRHVFLSTIRMRSSRTKGRKARGWNNRGRKRVEWPCCAQYCLERLPLGCEGGTDRSRGMREKLLWSSSRDSALEMRLQPWPSKSIAVQ